MGLAHAALRVSWDRAEEKKWERGSGCSDQKATRRSHREGFFCPGLLTTFLIYNAECQDASGKIFVAAAGLTREGL